MLVREEIDKDYLATLIDKVQTFIGKEVKCFILKCEEEEEYLMMFPGSAFIAGGKIVQGSK